MRTTARQSTSMIHTVKTMTASTQPSTATFDFFFFLELAVKFLQLPTRCSRFSARQGVSLHQRDSRVVVPSH